MFKLIKVLKIRKKKEHTLVQLTNPPIQSHAEVFSEVETRPVTNNGYLFFLGKKFRSHFDSTMF